MRSHFELSPAEYERKRQGHLQQRRVEIVRRAVEARARVGDVVLEIGCGPGDVLAAVARAHPGVHFVGLDVDERMIEHARAIHTAPNTEFRSDDLTATSLGENVRVVFGIDVVHHVRDLDGLAAAVAALLVRDGIWLVIEPNSRNPYIWLHQERMRRAGLDEAHFDRAAFEHAVRAHGLDIRDRSTAFLVPGRVRGRIPRAIAAVERGLERVPVLGGSVLYVIERA